MNSLLIFASVPSEIYGTKIRATCHGLSAAMGKLGAVVGTAAFTPLTNSINIFGMEWYTVNSI